LAAAGEIGKPSSGPGTVTGVGTGVGDGDPDGSADADGLGWSEVDGLEIATGGLADPDGIPVGVEVRRLQPATAIPTATMRAAAATGLRFIGRLAG
jgi:hypothetical protein